MQAKPPHPRRVFMQQRRSKSAFILDDPVTSLDHIRRGLVAARLAALDADR